ncbi:MAG: DEAD/DEAH box helicase [Planctomycetota bacterium]
MGRRRNRARDPAAAAAPLTARAARKFSRASIERGVDCWAAGDVEILSREGDVWTFEVVGSQPYEVELDTSILKSDPGECTCPGTDAFGPCKHLWACIVELDFLFAAAALFGGDPRTFRVGRDGKVQGWRSGARQLCAPLVELDLLGDGQPCRVALGWDDRDPLDAAFADELDEFAATEAAMGLETEVETLDEEWGQVAQEGSHGDHWPDRLARLHRLRPAPRAAPEAADVAFLVHADATRDSGQLVVWIAARTRRRDGRLGSWQLLNGRRSAELQPDDRVIARAVTMLLQLQSTEAHWWSTTPTPAHVPAELVGAVTDTLFATDRVYLWRERDARPRAPRELPPALRLDAEPFAFAVRHTRDVEAGTATVAVCLRRADQLLEMDDMVAILDRWVLLGDRLARVQNEGAEPLVATLAAEGALTVPLPHEPELLGCVLPLVGHAAVETPLLADAAEPPTPIASFDHPDRSRAPTLTVKLAHAYGADRVAAASPGSMVFLDGVVRPRDIATEQRAAARLQELGADPASDGAFRVPTVEFANLATTLSDEGWRVEAEGRALRKGAWNGLSVRSGIDWFDVHGELDFGGEAIPLPALLARHANGDRWIRLADGALGLLPSRWLEGWATALALGETQDDAVRLRHTQAWVIDMLLARRQDEQISFDAAARRRRSKLQKFAGVAPKDPPAAFAGKLREYQREGLGWLHVLADLSLGGCLADDMGLGKTIQVLALMAGRRRRRDRRPSLIVAPRSVITNWSAEAARFAPRLAVHEHHGPGRWKAWPAKDASAFAGQDLVLTTYDTMHRDVRTLADVPFDYLVLDEAQAIKNPSSQRAKAARALDARHRLALTGTPVENHLGELWSIFEFLNPGMLGSARAFKELLARQDDDTERPTDQPAFAHQLQRALRPFVLRRTKEQVLPELPPKSEQILRCELTGPQQRDYLQLRDHYRSSVLAKVDARGLARSKMHVLEALLRLRQLCCHRGLIDPDRRDEDSAKLEILLPRLTEVIEAGHKALVFSQFTSFLSIVRSRLDDLGVVYEWLDGRTRKRAERVERFQSDADCRVFLISLKAGGSGLNLTAADYVFLLDPWWNPAVEAQAIDRTHRIGQTRKVSAYRIIAADTIEEKVLALQEKKRGLQALFAGGSTSLRDLSRDDLEHLLS